MYKIGVIGDKDSVMGFLALGLTVFETSDAAQTAQIIRRAARKGMRRSILRSRRPPM